MHSERYEVPQATVDAILPPAAAAACAVGHDTLRALESAARGR